MKIAWFSPLNPMPSGIADYSEELLPSLARHATIDIYIDPSYTPSNAGIARSFAIRPFAPGTFKAQDYDRIVYHMGNDYSAHRYIYEAMQRFPGVVVLHDFVLMGFYAARQDAGRNFPDFIRFLQRFYPDKAAWIEEHCAGRHPFPLWEGGMALHLPMNEEIGRLATGVITHSHYVLARLGLQAGKPAAVIPQHGHPTHSSDRAAVRIGLGVKPDQILLISTGYVTRNKRYDLVLEVLKELNRPDLRYLIVGRDNDGILRRMLRSGRPDVLTRGFAPLAEMEKLIAAADIGINLRNPTMGESSGSLLRMLSSGRAVIVSDSGSYSEIPDHCAIKIDTGIDEKEMLKVFIAVLADDPALRAALGREAARHASEACAIDRCADMYAAFLRNIQQPGLPESEGTL
jgi:glycosyltransferase involved in cell wall biosynthesis